MTKFEKNLSRLIKWLNDCNDDEEFRSVNFEVSQASVGVYQIHLTWTMEDEHREKMVVSRADEKGGPSLAKAVKKAVRVVSKWK